MAVFLKNLTTGMIYSMMSSSNEFFVVKKGVDHTGPFICPERKTYDKDGHFSNDKDWKEASWEQPETHYLIHN